MKYIFLPLLLMGCNSSEINVGSFLPSVDLEHKRLTFNNTITKSFSETIKYDENCVFFNREYPILSAVDKNGKKITVAPSKYNYKICLKLNKLYYTDRKSMQEHIILSNKSWILDGVKCKTKAVKKQFIFKQEVETVEINCNDGTYAIYAKDYGMIESGIYNSSKVVETKLVSIGKAKEVRK